MEDNNWLQPIIALTTQKLSNSFQTLQGLNSPRKVSAEPKKELTRRKESVRCICGLFGSKAAWHFSYLAFYSFSHRDSNAERR